MIQSLKTVASNQVQYEVFNPGVSKVWPAGQIRPPANFKCPSPNPQPQWPCCTPRQQSHNPPSTTVIFNFFLYPYLQLLPLFGFHLQLCNSLRENATCSSVAKLLLAEGMWIWLASSGGSGGRGIAVWRWRNGSNSCWRQVWEWGLVIWQISWWSQRMCWPPIWGCECALSIEMI